jgi:hypothetical protein
MNTSSLLGACVALLTATVSLRADINPEDLSGNYHAEGEGYGANVTIRKSGERYDVEWRFGIGLHTGVGIREGNLFSSSFVAAGQAGVVVYKIERDRLVGKFTAPGMQGPLAVETLTPLAPLAAKAVPPPEPARPLEAGARVAARWNRNSFYLATVKSREGGTYHIVYDDTTPAEVTIADLLPIVKPDESLAGRRVLACWSADRLYPGTVLGTEGAKSVFVKWDDGTAPTEVAKEKIALLPAGFPLDPLAAELAPAPGGKAFEVGARVAARWARTEFYLATVKASEGVLYHVLYDDNDQADVTNADLLPVAKQNEIISGRRVLACWASAKMYPGVVLEVKGPNAIVKWDDGSEPSPVAKEKIALLPAGFQ